MENEEKYRLYAKKIKIFHGLDPEDVSRILHQGHIFQFHSGKTIFHEGMLGNSLFIVLSGKIAIRKNNKIIAQCSVGDAFGEMAVLNQKPRCASATAESPVKLFTLGERELNEILDRRVAVRILLNIIHLLSERLELANKRFMTE